MGIYTEYLDRGLSFDQLQAERKTQLKRIATIRNRAVLAFVADLTKRIPQTAIGYDDLLPIKDQVANLKGESLDLILETPGGSGEVAEDIVSLLRTRFRDLAVVVPGTAKSAGTIMTMAGDEILMSPTSALGPIDAQILNQGKVFSADALIEGFEKIKEEVERTGQLNKAFIPMLQAISPGELQGADNALKFAKVLVTNWLAQYKFKNWVTHSSTKLPVTEPEKRVRAEEVAKQLCNHRSWLTHGRSIRMSDLRAMRLVITDYTQTPDLADALDRYFTLLQMTMSPTNAYKIVETETTQIYRFTNPMVPQQTPSQAPQPLNALIQVQCLTCSTTFEVQADFDQHQPMKAGAIAFPKDNRVLCPKCRASIDLSATRLELEGRTKKRVL